MKKYPLQFATILFIISLLIQSEVLASAETLSPFLIDLKQGMNNPDVLLLQKYLNSNGFPVASSGPGSIGNETTYFGKGTKEALINFQNAHKDEILAPLGLTLGSGNFYFNTRNFINNHLNKTSETPVTQKEFVATSTNATTTETIVLPPPPILGKNVTPPSIFGHHRHKITAITLIDPTIIFNDTTGFNDGTSFPYLVNTAHIFSNSDGAVTYFLASGDPTQFSVNGVTGEVYALQAYSSGTIQIGATQAASGQYNSKTVYANLVIFNLA